jgi:hypothetical protein
MIRKYHFDGMDLNVEEDIELRNIVRLIKQLKMTLGQT